MRFGTDDEAKEVLGEPGEEGGPSKDGEVAVHLGYVQRFGYGIPLARRLLRDDGNPEPVFDTDANSFLVTVRPRRTRA